MSEEPGRAAQTTLHTARITLVPLADEHFEGEVELDTDGEVMRYLTGRPRTRAPVEVMHRKRLAIGRDSAGLGFWAGLVEGSSWAGGSSNRPSGPNNDGSAGRPSWAIGCCAGIGGAGWRARARVLIRPGFADLGLDRILAETMAVNRASRATMESVGLRYVRTFHLAFAEFDEPLPGTDQGEVEYAMTRDQWAAVEQGR